VLECQKREIPEGKGKHSSGLLSFLEGSSAGMLEERDTGGGGKTQQWTALFLRGVSSDAGMSEERDTVTVGGGR